MKIITEIYSQLIDILRISGFLEHKILCEQDQLILVLLTHLAHNQSLIFQPPLICGYNVDIYRSLI